MPYFIAREANGNIYFEGGVSVENFLPIIPVWRRGSAVIGFIPSLECGYVPIQLGIDGGPMRRPHDPLLPQLISGDVLFARPGTWEDGTDIEPITWRDI